MRERNTYALSHSNHRYSPTYHSTTTHLITYTQQPPKMFAYAEGSPKNQVFGDLVVFLPTQNVHKSTPQKGDKSIILSTKAA